MDTDKKNKNNEENPRRYVADKNELAGEPITDDHQARTLKSVDPDENNADEVLYGGAESDFDREYWDNSDAHEYYDEPDKEGYHPDES
jgi:hypothetical protein